MNGSTPNQTGMEMKVAHHEGQNGSDSNRLGRISEALLIVHSPYSSNESRQQASLYLEEIKADDEAPYHGFTLACDRNQEPVIRHYALSLLEHAIKHRWTEFSEAQAYTLRSWILQLAENIDRGDPLYLRNKTAQLWVEVAKRTWGGDWLDMDELLVRLWETTSSMVHKEFVLFVLETLSEEVFNGDDATAAMREGVLSKACVEIFTPAEVLSKSFPDRHVGAGVRYREDGWLVRLGLQLEICLDGGVDSNEEYRTCAVKILSVFRSTMPWAIPNAIAGASCVMHMSTSLAAPSIPVQMASIEALYALYSRPHFSDDEFISLACPMYTTRNVDLLQKIYEWSVVDSTDIDDEKYLLAKKFSEMMSNLGSFIVQKVSSIPEDCDLPNLLNLFLSIVKSQSLVVSIPVLVTWTRLLRSETISNSPTIEPLIAPLLELCSSRLLRYENLPENSDDPCVNFLLEDMDTIPERHAFLGNYRRYSIQAIELIVRRKQSVAIYHIMGQVGQNMEHLYDGQPQFSEAATYSKTSMPILQVDAQFSVVEAAIKGYTKWQSSSGKTPEDEQERVRMEGDFETWCGQLLEMNFEDPSIRKRVLHLVVAFSTTALLNNSAFMLKVLEHILMSRPIERPEYSSYSDAVKELQSDAMHELNRLATKMPDQLLEVFDQLEAKVNEIIASGNLDSKQRVAYQTFLFTIIHRSKTIDPTLRMQRLKSFIEPVKELWHNPQLDEAVSTFSGFCDLLGLGRIRDYLVSHRVHEIAEWGSYQLDPEGQEIQAELNERVKALPLRPTKSFLGCSTDKVEKDSATYNISCELWSDSVAIILPDLLKFLSHAHSFHNPANWSGLPDEMKPIVGQILTDRFWQAGISEGSKDDFYARVSGTRSTMEGLASSIRGAVRTVREACYSILYGMSRLGVHFYGFNELPGPLAHALFADAHCLSSHQLINLLTLVRYLVDDCPVELRDHFVPPILATCFTQIDGKISSEWEQLAKKQQATSDEDNLTEEMKEESILRQLTHSAVMMVASLFDPARSNTSTAKEASTHQIGGVDVQKWPTMRNFCLASTPILESLLLFSTHAIRMRDTRSCGVVLRVFRSIVPAFERMPAIREFVSAEVMKACITSLHEPYFVDLHKDLAQLIASILIHYCKFTETPKQILLSLPGLNESSVEKCIEYVTNVATQQRQQRALVLDLLDDLKGVSISEQGRILKAAATIKKERSKMQQEFMTIQPVEPNTKQGSPDLDGVANLFG